MQKAAQFLCAQYDGQMPQTYEQIVALPGIGPYTAGAIASIAFDERVPAVDGNVLRILARVSEDDRDILKDATKKRMTAALQQIMPKEAGAFNQALMEIGALVCIPNGQPKCEECPWQSYCQACKHETYDRLPVKTKAKPRRIERPPKGLLAGLYELPNLPGYLKEEEVLTFVRSQNLAPLQIKKLPDAKHIFSHIEWLMQGYLVQVADVDSFHSDEALSKGPEDYLLVEIEKTKNAYAIPSAFDRYATYIALRD